MRVGEKCVGQPGMLDICVVVLDVVPHGPHKCLRESGGNWRLSSEDEDEVRQAWIAEIPFV